MEFGYAKYEVTSDADRAVTLNHDLTLELANLSGLCPETASCCLCPRGAPAAPAAPSGLWIGAGELGRFLLQLCSPVELPRKILSAPRGAFQCESDPDRANLLQQPLR